LFRVFVPPKHTTVLFPDALCGRWSQRPALTGANGPVSPFSGA
jgi:hypothetical protein